MSHETGDTSKRPMIFDPVDPERVARIRKDLEVIFAKPVSEAEVAKALPGVPYRRNGLITLTKLSDVRFAINADLIETIEETPDTVLTLATGRKYIVKESIDEIRQLCVEYKQQIHSGWKSGQESDRAEGEG